MKTGILRIEGLRGGETREIIEYLTSVETVYNHLCALELVIEEARTKQVRSLKPVSRKDLARVIKPEERLRIKRVVIESPGFWEFIGNLNPLETLRKYLHDRHERRKDLEYKERLEAERMALENEQIRTEIIKERAQLLRDHGYAEHKIRRLLIAHMIEPLERIEKWQDVGLVASAVVTLEPSLIEHLEHVKKPKPKTEDKMEFER